jgi:hypothetical protein
VNVLHFVRSSNAYDLDDLTNLLDSYFTSDMWGLSSSADVCSHLEITALYDTSSSRVFTLSSPIVGQGGGDYWPNSCGLIKMTTDQRGKSYRGRVYLPDIAETFVDNGVIKTANQNATTTAWDTFANLMVGSDQWALGIVSYVHNNAPRTTGVITQVTNVGCESHIATQRRRNRRS